jgi:hypothetical protein
MFIRKRGRLCLILTSYRDGQGKVRQRRLGHFRDRETLERAWASLSDSGLGTSLASLRPRAEQLLEELGGSEPHRRAKKSSRSLLALLADYPELAQLDEVKQLALRLQPEPVPGSGEESLRRKVEWEAVRLHPRRHKYGPGEAGLAGYLKSKLELSQHLRQQGLAGLEELRATAEELPESLASLDYAAQLHCLGELEQAKQFLLQLPRELAWRDFNLAACYWSQAESAAALRHLLAALSRDEWVWEALDAQFRGRRGGLGQPYWDRYGQLWDEAGRRFFLTIARLPGVRFNRSEARREGRRPRKLMPDFTHKWILQKALAAAAN